ncbi:MAG TPA: ATP-binding cassette domain-containing protein, partial [Firmicutes bacterium]|nr:ATP-binding cassette domain-containing protein [Bacillota bacterium]
MRAGPLLAIKNVSKIFFSPAGEVPALNDINLNIYTGEFISIVGPSGCGKSTLLNIIAGLIAPSKGQVFINGLEVTGPSVAVGYMPQGDHLFNWRTIWRNVLLGLEVQNKVNEETKAFAYKLLQTYGLADF